MTTRREVMKAPSRSSSWQPEIDQQWDPKVSGKATVVVVVVHGIMWLVSEVKLSLKFVVRVTMAVETLVWSVGSGRDEPESDRPKPGYQPDRSQTSAPVDSQIGFILKSGIISDKKWTLTSRLPAPPCESSDRQTQIRIGSRSNATEIGFLRA